MPEHVCARCPQVHGKSCCEVGPGQKLATLTPGDVDRIERHTGQPSSAFVAEERFTVREQRRYEALRPANRGVVNNGLRRHLRDDGRACVFHSSASGCTLPLTVRPLLCRLYPFEIDDAGELRIYPGDACLAVESAPSLAKLLASLGARAADLSRWHAQLMRELA